MIKLFFSMKLTFLLAILLFSNFVQAAQWATVKSDKAIIYSDAKMSSSIGYISKGKKVRVGSKKKNYRQVLPIIVNQKVAYIKVEDLYTEKQLEEIEALNKRLANLKNRKRVEKVISLRAGVLSSTVSYGGDDKLGEDEYSASFTHTGLTTYFIDHQEKKTSRFSLDYYQTVNDDETLSIALLDFAFVRSIFHSFSSQLSYYASIGLAPYVMYKYSDLVEVNGQGAGGKVGIEYLQELLFNMTFALDANYSYIKVLNLNIEDTSVFAETLEPVIQGANISFSLGFKFD